MKRVDDAVAWGARRLSEADIDSPRREARLLLAHVLDSDVGHLIGHGETAITAQQWDGFSGCLARRVAREPISRITGRREFWGLEFLIGQDTLDPRPDSETLVQAALRRFDAGASALRVLDLGTGSGCLLISLLVEWPQAWGVGIDRCAEACRMAADNAAALGVAGRSAFCVADWCAVLSGPFDVVVCNPPYIVSSDIPDLAPEVSGYDPHRALDGGEGGLACYRALAPQLFQCLADDGLAFLEVGEGQVASVQSILRQAGFGSFERQFDLAGRARCLIAGR